jgi:hypothetical protein
MTQWKKEVVGYTTTTTTPPPPTITTTTTRVVSQCGLAICIKKYLKAKKKNYGNSNTFHHAKI